MGDDVGTLSPPAAATGPGQQSDRAFPTRRPRVELTVLAVGVFLLSRVLTTAALLAASRVSGLSVRLIVVKWDAHWYLSVAQHGYPAATGPLPGQAELRFAFLPLFPLVLRPVAGQGPNAILWATAIGAVLGMAATAATAHLAYQTARTMGVPAVEARGRAVRATALFAFFPGAVVLSLAYTEGLTLVLAVGCLLSLMHRRWLAAGVLAALAGAARPNALALVAACCWASYEAVRTRREWRSLIAPLLAPTGFVAYLAYLQVHVGSWLAWHEVEQRAWHQKVDLSWKLLRLMTPPQIVRHALKTDWYYFSILLGLVFVVVAAAAYTRWRPPGILTAYTLGALAFCFAASNVGPRPRMVLMALPLFLACGAVLQGRRYAALLAACSLGTVAMSYFVSVGRIIP